MIKICYVTTLSVSIKAFFIPQLKFLAENGFEVTVICSKDDTLQELLGDNVRYIPVEIPRGVSFFGSIKAIRNLKAIFKKEQFDFIQYSTPNAAFYSSIAAKKVKAKIRNYHLMGLRYLGEKGIKRKILYFLEKLACKNSTHVECVSPSNLRLAISEGLFDESKGKVVWNGSSGGLDLNRFDGSKREEYCAEIRNKYQINKDEFVYGFVGRITRDKGVNEILEAFLKMENAKLLMVGPKEGEDTLNKDIYQRSLMDERIIYTGSVDEVEKYYCAMDVLLFPSYREGFGNVVMEAAAMGTTAIISNIPGPIDEVIEGETALVVEAKDSEALYNAMVKMADKDFAESLAKKAREYVAKSFDQEILIKHILENKLNLLKG